MRWKRSYSKGRLGEAKKLQFLVKWQGYDPSEAIWELESHLQNAPLKVQDYWDSIKATGNAVLGEQELESDGEMYYDCMQAYNLKWCGGVVRQGA